MYDSHVMCPSIRAASAAAAQEPVVFIREHKSVHRSGPRRPLRLVRRGDGGDESEVSIDQGRVGRCGPKAQVSA